MSTWKKSNFLLHIHFSGYYSSKWIFVPTKPAQLPQGKETQAQEHHTGHQTRAKPSHLRVVPTFNVDQIVNGSGHWRGGAVDGKFLATGPPEQAVLNEIYNCYALHIYEIKKKQKKLDDFRRFKVAITDIIPKHCIVKVSYFHILHSKYVKI